MKDPGAFGLMAVEWKPIAGFDIQLLEFSPAIDERRQIVMEIDFLRIVGRHAVQFHRVAEAVIDKELDAVNPGMARGAIKSILCIDAETDIDVYTDGLGDRQSSAATREPAEVLRHVVVVHERPIAKR